MGKQIIDLIGELVPISSNSTVDSIIFTIICSISFMVAFGIVGLIFNFLGFYDSDIMSDTHWIIRVLIFLGLTWLGVKIAQLIKWIFSFQWWIYVIAGIIFVGIVILAYYIKYRISQKKAQHVVTVEKAKIETIEETNEKKEDKDISEEGKCFCPRCHSKLVKRHGPYGNFYGCESYSKTGCRYTRKFL